MKEYKKNETQTLYLNKNYDDNVTAFKLLLNLCDSDEVRNLGNEIVDSYLLFTFLKNNPFLKNCSKNYLPLLESLASSINEYSRFYKLLRENKVCTRAKIEEKNDSSEFVFDNTNEKGFNLMDILKEYNLLEKIIIKDSKKTFKDYIESERKKNLTNYNNFTYSLDANEIIQKKKNILAQTIIGSDELSDGQVELYGKIDDEYKNLILKEKEIAGIELVEDSLINKTYILKNTTVEVYRKFKDELNNILASEIKNRVKLCEQLNLDLDTYENLLDVKSDKLKEESRDEELYKECINDYNSYIEEISQNTKYGKLSFTNYIKCVKPNNIKLINYAQENENDLISMYADYLIYKFSKTNENDILPFTSYVLNNNAIENKKKV